MPTQKAVVAAPAGLHARSAAVFVRAVTATGLPVTISKPGTPAVDARSLLHVMAADFAQGCEVELAVSDTGLRAARGLEEVRTVLADLRVLLESQKDG
ncbi:HPr family phosphocarrier protein [Pseudarthrobacter sp. C4D7]|uniref:HPr family phosphocarrier protein n=1 Tax=Pseudarthrobacter sp. C4D7 TaxID=2735268 RepID=UPI0015846C86|nr:HPr family phosphocarrier protein [Pseudarthrobacter sp. C4D7]NUT72082.1 HPr family phosphocarrier protein [Pseudarthrobacter sp. C4D7]